MPTEEPTERSPSVRRHVGLAAVVLLTAVALALTTLLGGWAPATSDGPVLVAPGTEIEATPFAVTLHGATATYEAGGREAEAGRAFLVVDGVLSLEASEYVGAGTVSDAFFAELTHGYTYGSEAENPSPEILVAEDGIPLIGIGPGLAYDVEFTFTVDEADVPDRMTVVVLEHVRRRSSLDDSLGWFDPAAVARVTVDVAPLPAERPAQEEF